MKIIRSIWFMVLLCCPLAYSSAATIKPQLILNQIKALKTQERSGDELYVDLAFFGENLPRQYLRFPTEPQYWSSAVLPSVKNISLWSESIAEGDTVYLEFSLLESDSSNFNPDDMIGTVRLVLKNEAGKLQASWSLPNLEKGPLEIANQSEGLQTIQLTGSNASYAVDLSLKQ